MYLGAKPAMRQVQVNLAELSPVRRPLGLYYMGDLMQNNQAKAQITRYSDEPFAG